ncbi:MAG: hypothetical protein GY811_07175 [Myxococcales bacterium]|nr:hypothetical protein [Myxococcales bacterium]
MAGLIADGKPIELAGDNLFVDLDLSALHLPPGSLLRVGSLILVVSKDTYLGGQEFGKCFGEDALRWVNDKAHRHRRLRGVLCEVIGPGLVCEGDSVQRIDGHETLYPNGRPWLVIRGERVVFRGENGRMEAEGYVVDGEQHGLWRYYRSTGVVHLEGQYRFGNREGRWLGYWASGERAWLMRYEAGMRISGEFYAPSEECDRLLAEAEAIECLAFDSYEATFQVAGPTALVARAKYFGTTNQLASLEIIDADGDIFGTRHWCHSGDELRTDEGVRSDGEWRIETSYHASGNRKSQERRRNGKLDGESSYWDEEGKMTHLDVYEEGVLKVTRSYVRGALSSMSLHLPDGSVRVSEIRRAS